MASITYLHDPHVQARVLVLHRTPQAPEALYTRMLSAILNWLFTPEEKFSVLLEDMAGDMHPTLTVYQLLSRPGGSLYEYDFLLAETEVPNQSWNAFTDYLHTVCASTNNESKNVYGLLQIGFEVQFFKHENDQFGAIGDRMHLIDDVHDVIAMAQYMKANPMPFI